MEKQILEELKKINAKLEHLIGMQLGKSGGSVESKAAAYDIRSEIEKAKRAAQEKMTQAMAKVKTE